MVHFLNMDLSGTIALKNGSGKSDCAWNITLEFLPQQGFFSQFHLLVFHDICDEVYGCLGHFL